MTATWVKIKGFENYEVNQVGCVRNTIGNKVLKPTLNTWGYPCVTLCFGGKRKNIPVHRLVAEAFIPNTANLPEINHLDEDKTNNFVQNLEWTTKKGNVNHGTRTQRASVKKYKPVIQYTLSGCVVKVWGSLKEAEQHGFRHSAISECCHGKRNTHQGYRWGWAT